MVNRIQVINEGKLVSTSSKNDKVIFVLKDDYSLCILKLRSNKIEVDGGKIDLKKESSLRERSSRKSGSRSRTGERRRSSSSKSSRSSNKSSRNVSYKDSVISSRSKVSREKLNNSMYEANRSRSSSRSIK